MYPGNIIWIRDTPSNTKYLKLYLKSCKRLIFIILAYSDVLSIVVSVFLSPIISGFSFKSDKIKSDKLKSDILTLKIEHFEFS